MMIKDILDKIGKPVNLLSKDDNLKIVKHLFNNKIFKIKGAVDALANKLKVSRYTIYNYLDQIKVNSNNWSKLKFSWNMEVILTNIGKIEIS